jgi:hypothetical protein
MSRLAREHVAALRSRVSPEVLKHIGRYLWFRLKVTIITECLDVRFDDPMEVLMFDVEVSDTIGSVKARFHHATGYSRALVVFTDAGRMADTELEDEVTLSHYDIGEGGWLQATIRIPGLVPCNLRSHPMTMHRAEFVRLDGTRVLINVEHSIGIKRMKDEVFVQTGIRSADQVWLHHGMEHADSNRQAALRDRLQRLRPSPSGSTTTGW